MKGCYGIQPIPGDDLFTEDRIQWCLMATSYFSHRRWRRTTIDEDEILSIAMESIWKVSLRGVGDEDLLTFAFGTMRLALIDYARHVLARKRSPTRCRAGRDDGDESFEMLDAGDPNPLHVVMAADMLRKRQAEYGRACSRCHKAVSILRRGLCHACYKHDLYVKTVFIPRECAGCHQVRKICRRRLCRRCYDKSK